MLKRIKCRFFYRRWRATVFITPVIELFWQKERQVQIQQPVVRRGQYLFVCVILSWFRKGVGFELRFTMEEKIEVHNDKR